MSTSRAKRPLADPALGDESTGGGKHTASTACEEVEAIRRGQKGEAAGFEFLYRLHSRRVFALCLRMLGNRTDAEDLTQETFLLVYRKIKSFRQDSAFSSWVHRVAVNAVLMHLRKKVAPTVSLDAERDSNEETGKAPTEVGAPDPRLTGSVDRDSCMRKHYASR